MKTLYSLIKKLAAACRDLFCFVLAWVLWGISLGLVMFPNVAAKYPWLAGAAFKLAVYSRAVQAWSPTLTSPHSPTT